MITFGERLTQRRIEKRLTQKDLAEKLGKSNHSTIANWESDKAKPSADDLLILAELLEVTTDWLLKGVEFKETNQIGESTTEYKLLQQNAELQQKIIELQERIINTQAADLDKLKNDKLSVAEN